MKIINGFPANDYYHMPGEFEHHKGCIMIWPIRPGSWKIDSSAARAEFLSIAKEISSSEELYMLTDAEHVKEVEYATSQYPSIHVLEIESDDSWARDVGPTFVVNKDRNVRGINWSFNAWGGSVDGLYSSWDKDDKVARLFCEKESYDMYDASPFVLEGGSIHSDGEGTLITTSACLLSKGRNPDLTRNQIEDKLRLYLGIKKILWLPHGIYEDETNEHVDNVCAFTAPGEAVLAWTDDQNDPQYEYSSACLKYLESETDAYGRKIKVTKLPIPSRPVCINEKDLEGLIPEPGEAPRSVGERLAASYVNFYIANNSVIVPQFGDSNDAKALEILGNLFTGRTITGINSREILLGGGNIHCITQQIPG